MSVGRQRQPDVADRLLALSLFDTFNYNSEKNWKFHAWFEIPHCANNDDCLFFGVNLSVNRY